MINELRDTIKNTHIQRNLIKMAEKNVRWAAIIPAAGESRRMNGINKLFANIDGKPMLSVVLRKLQDVGITDLYVGVRPGTSNEIFGFVLRTTQIKDTLHLVPGGTTRQETISNCILKLKPAVTHVMVHDAARPYVTEKLLAKIMEDTITYSATCAAIPLVDTLHRADKEGNIEETISRENLWRAQTPQAFERSILEKAYASKLNATDEAMLVTALGHSVRLVRGEESNIKVTFPEDIRA